MDIFKAYQVSLGYNCCPKIYLKAKEETKDIPTHYFDRIGTSAWSVYRLLKFDFLEHADTSRLRHAYMHQKKKTGLIMNKKYYMRLMHYFPKSKNCTNISQVSRQELQSCFDLMERRKERFIELLNNKDIPILFYRQEEAYDPERLLYGPIKKVYPRNRQELSDFEYHYIEKTSELFRKKYLRNNFAILYFSESRKKNLDIKNQIITIPIEKDIIWTEAVEKYNKIMKKHYEFIDDCLKQILTKIDSS